MVKKYLQLLLERDYREPTMPKTIKMLLETFDDDQLDYMLHTGLKISDDITLYYFEGQGFRCSNDNVHIIGHKPVCNVIEKVLNEKIIKS